MLMKSTVALVALTVAVPAWAQNATCPPMTAEPLLVEAASDRLLPMSADEAVAFALENDLRREAARAAIAAARTERRIASFRPPDELSFQTEDFPRSGPVDDIGTLEVTASFARVWERGGKREAREAVAARGINIAEADAAISDSQIAYEVRRLYAAVLIAKSRQVVACMEIGHINEIKGAIDERVRRSADPLLAATRVSTELLAAEAELQGYRAQETAFLEQLAALTGQDAGFGVDESALTQRPDIRAIDLSFSSYPDLLALDARQREARARVALEQANRQADITWNVGIRNFGVSDDFGLVTGVSIPLGTGARSNAQVARARAEQMAIEAEKRALVQQLVRETTALRQSSMRAVTMLETLDTQLIPEAAEALDLAEQGYARGALAFRDILDAHEVLIALHRQRADHLETFLMNDATLQRLSGDVAAMEIQP